jgi:1-deoxyxylulose-5-phosphate synthase
MEYTRFGRTGLSVSRLALGTMTFGNQLDEEQSGAVLDAAVAAGITFLDLADSYPIGAPDKYGTTERIVGRWLAGRRDELIIATKCNRPSGRTRWDRGNSRKNVLRAIDASLGRLGIDYIDIYQVHAWDPDTPIDETLGALDDLVRAGKVRYVGCSNFRPHQVARSLGRAEVGGTARFESVQWRYNLLFRAAEPDLLPLCAEEGLALLPYNPLAGGMLTGKHNRGEPTPGGRFSVGLAAPVYAARYWNDSMFDLVDELRALAASTGVSPATLALQWVLANPVVTSTLVGASRPDQLAAAVAAVEQPIDAGVKSKLDQLSQQFLPAEDVPWG